MLQSALPAVLAVYIRSTKRHFTLHTLLIRQKILGFKMSVTFLD